MVAVHFVLKIGAREFDVVRNVGYDPLPDESRSAEQKDPHGLANGQLELNLPHCFLPQIQPCDRGVPNGGKAHPNVRRFSKFGLRLHLSMRLGCCYHPALEMTGRCSNCIQN